MPFNVFYNWLFVLRYFVEQRLLRGAVYQYIIHWFNEHAGYGTVKTVLIDDKLIVDDGTRKTKLWLQKLNKVIV